MPVCRSPDEARPQQLPTAPRIDRQGWCRFYHQDGYFGSYAYKNGSARIPQARLGEISLAAGQQRLTVSPVDVQLKLFLKFILPPQSGMQAPAKVEGECQVWEKMLMCIVLPLNFFSSQEDIALLSSMLFSNPFCKSPVARVARRLHTCISSSSASGIEYYRLGRG